MVTIAIPSYKRSDQINLKTLATLRRGGVTQSEIFIFVISEELQLYQQSCPGYHVIPGVLGLVNQREFIQNYFALETYIIMLDDDISEIYKSTSLKTKENIIDLPGVFQKMIGQMESSDSKICGIYPCDNIKFSFSNSAITTDYKYIVGAFYIIKNLREGLRPSEDSLEDRERTVLYWLKYKKILRFNHIFTKTKYFGRGGLQSDDRLSKHSSHAKLLVTKYPEFLRLKESKGFTDCKCRKIKSYKE